VIIWLNGTFGAGKTTTAELVARKSRRLRTFDPEWVGYMLRENLGDHPVRDFRDWQSWRILTPLVADELIRFTGQSLVAPQTVIEESYWDEITQGLSKRGHGVFHVLIQADEAVMRTRIQADEVAVQGRLDHLPRFARARAWMARRADLVVDTTRLTPALVADRVWAATKDLVQ
jgi:hypothetical protein